VESPDHQYDNHPESAKQSRAYAVGKKSIIHGRSTDVVDYEIVSPPPVSMIISVADNMTLVANTDAMSDHAVCNSKE
jgi:hypothetical protein